MAKIYDVHFAPEEKEACLYVDTYRVLGGWPFKTKSNKVPLLLKDFDAAKNDITQSLVQLNSEKEKNSISAVLAFVKSKAYLQAFYFAKDESRYLKKTYLRVPVPKTGCKFFVDAKDKAAAALDPDLCVDLEKQVRHLDFMRFMFEDTPDYTESVILPVKSVCDNRPQV